MPIHRVFMKFAELDHQSSMIAASVAPEDLRREDFVAVLHEVVEWPSFYWPETLARGQEHLIRVSRLPTDERVPLKIKAICLPFVFVKKPTGEFQTIDIRLTQLARLDRAYARTVWKSLKPRTVTEQATA